MSMRNLPKTIHDSLLMRTLQANRSTTTSLQQREITIHLTVAFLKVCRQSEFRCATGNTCLPLHLVCDNVVNCIDGSDEKDCPEITTAILTTTPKVSVSPPLNITYTQSHESV